MQEEEEEVDVQGSWIRWRDGCRRWKDEELVEEPWMGRRNVEDCCGGG